MAIPKRTVLTSASPSLNGVTEPNGVSEPGLGTGRPCGLPARPAIDTGMPSEPMSANSHIKCDCTHQPKPWVAKPGRAFTRDAAILPGETAPPNRTVLIRSLT